LGIDDRQCGIRSRVFLEALAAKEPELCKFVKDGNVDKWIDVMADMRHAAAHRTMLLPTSLVEESDDSQKSDAEISAILRQEDPEFYEMTSPEFDGSVDPLKIWHWRMERLKQLADNIVVVKKESGGYIRAAVASVDYDLSYLNSVIDAFLVKLFSTT